MIYNSSKRLFVVFSDEHLPILFDKSRFLYDNDLKALRGGRVVFFPNHDIIHLLNKIKLCTRYIKLY